MISTPDLAEMPSPLSPEQVRGLAVADESGTPAAFRAFVAERVLESLHRYEEALG